MAVNGSWQSSGSKFMAVKFPAPWTLSASRGTIAVRATHTAQRSPRPGPLLNSALSKPLSGPNVQGRGMDLNPELLSASDRLCVGLVVQCMFQCRVHNLNSALSKPLSGPNVQYCPLGQDNMPNRHQKTHCVHHSCCIVPWVLGLPKWPNGRIARALCAHCAQGTPLESILFRKVLLGCEIENKQGLCQEISRNEGKTPRFVAKFSHSLSFMDDKQRFWPSIVIAIPRKEKPFIVPCYLPRISHIAERRDGGVHTRFAAGEGSGCDTKAFCSAADTLLGGGGVGVGGGSLRIERPPRPPPMGVCHELVGDFWLARPAFLLHFWTISRTIASNQQNWNVAQRLCTVPLWPINEIQWVQFLGRAIFGNSPSFGSFLFL